ncbi:MAG: class I SAM-dependent rRNA methyltransferase [Puniceicoccales bacterium]|jgi:23S rRNA (cytosine1962-C5)-methyltransferase|nr:class I SAM-dependent rRNA methyltransferase [Puniceicoccales bacterium]
MDTPAAANAVANANTNTTANATTAAANTADSLRAPLPLPVPPAQRAAPWAQLKYHTHHPHIYRNMIGEHSSPIPGGAITRVFDRDGRPFGTGFCNLAAKVALRVFKHGADFVGEDFCTEALRRAAAFRKDWLRLDDSTDAYRVVHADADALGGLVVDRYADTLSAEVTSLAAFQRLTTWLPVLHNALGTRNSIVQVDDAIARVEGIDKRLAPATPDRASVKIRENGVRYTVDFAQGHKTGFFCDQRDNRRKLAALAQGRRLLDVCCYTGGFSIAAKLGGAAEVTGVDLDEKAVAQARANANLNQCRANFIHADGFSYMRQMLRNGSTWDAVLLDPPKFIDGRDAFETGLKKYNDLNVLGLLLTAPGGLFVTCSCSGLLTAEEFEELVVKAAHRYGRRLQIFDRTGAGADHPALSNYPGSRYLKVLWARAW